MGLRITHLSSFFNRSDEYNQTVHELAIHALSPILSNGAPKRYSHMVVATTCPDTLAPTLGQGLNQYYYPLFANCHVLDLVQGCAGGVSAMVLGSQLSGLYKNNVLVVIADAARQSVAHDNSFRENFGNGSFACVLEYDESNRALIHHKTKQYENLAQLVSVKLGHHAHHEILSNQEEIIKKPLDYLGLSMNPLLAMKLIRQAETFYNEFISECGEEPDVMIFHQVNVEILNTLQDIFSVYRKEFINEAAVIGNCGAASFGIALDRNKEKVTGKKVLLCSFGTGGVISAGLWQF